MKAFIAVTLLAACVAAQTVDQTQTGLFNPLFWKNTNNYWPQQYQYQPSQYGVKGFQYTPTTYNPYNTVKGYYTLEEIVNHPLFAQYYTLPLFRQHFTHPLFQVYLTTPYFQQYWIYPEFQTFFRNPYLFYKYVYPVVYNTATQGVYEPTFWNKDVNNVWNKDINTVWNKDINNVWNKDVPTIFNKDINTVWNKNVPTIFNKDINTVWNNNKDINAFVAQYEQQNLVRPFLGMDKTYLYQNQMPIKQYQTVAYPFNMAYPTNTNQVKYTILLNKIFKDLFVNKPEVTEVKTDVKILKPTEETVGKYVDPITGEVKYTVGDIKNVEDKMIHIPIPVEDMKMKTYINKPVEFLTEGELTKDAILKKLFLNKALYEKMKVNQPFYPTEEQTFVPTEEWKKYETLPTANKMEKLNEELIMNKFENLPTLNRARRHAVYTPVTKPLTYNYVAQNQPIYKNAKALNYYTVPVTGAQTYYTVPLTYGAQTPYTPITYTVPTYAHQQYQVTPNLYYPGQTIIA